MLKKIIKNESGQSLMEMLIAIFILILALTATIVLIVTSINAARDSMNKLVATNLSREGIEIVRNIRDSNWIHPDGEDWDKDLDTDNTAIPEIDGTSNISLDFTPADFSNPLLVGIKLSGNDYVQGASATGNNTLFTRLIYLNPICHDYSNPPAVDETIIDTGTCAGNYEKVGVRVISEVRWHATNSNRKVILEDRLYNWQNL
ncbi:MAG: type IV pilus modification PilV family protein [Candidatus Kerfeldbacteria bacterium]|jgi:type II secretory pathway pseudopilin PulG